ncbi:UNKNOWN [Stylonychia lemnae]|uniref:Uncharacterized protein n=1 Tax=Stylonychia lemnae TaxID=5949 RepID=A0A078AJT6_STYLE|nr:UNKNOWN [Stylonychia lemnae]|eukprot:CDW81073.1 UNKNOWN [Stylonychia lemnae]
MHQFLITSHEHYTDPILFQEKLKNQIHAIRQKKKSVDLGSSAFSNKRSSFDTQYRSKLLSMPYQVRQYQNSTFKSENDLINLDNVQYFINQCFSSQAPRKKPLPMTSVQTPMSNRNFKIPKKIVQINEELQYEQEMPQLRFRIPNEDEPERKDAPREIHEHLESSNVLDKTSLLDRKELQMLKLQRKITTFRRESKMSLSQFHRNSPRNRRRESSNSSQYEFTPKSQNERWIELDGLKTDDLIKKFETLIKDKLFYQDLFKLGFNLQSLDKSLKILNQEQKMILINCILDLLFRTDKLKHAFPPLKMQQFKKQNARPYDFKEKEFQVAFGGGGEDESNLANQLRESQLFKRGIKVSESINKRKITSRFSNIQKSLDVIEQNKLNSKLK